MAFKSPFSNILKQFELQPTFQFPVVIFNFGNYVKPNSNNLMSKKEKATKPTPQYLKSPILTYNLRPVLYKVSFFNLLAEIDEID